IVQQMLDRGDIYLGAYEGWYDEGQEEFVTETEAKERQYLAFNKKPLVRYAEPTYFFRLKKYAPRVLAHIEQNPGFVRPESRHNEVMSKLKAGVDDLSISRATLKWGIPMKNDPLHVVYVWIDALSNYITALGYGQADDGRFRKYWPVDVHLIGKEILWFHAVYWPAMLMSLEIPLPHQVFAHGWWTAEGQKMSKTLGNFIDLERLRQIIATYGLDTLRYYLLRAAPFGNDLDFSQTDLVAAHTELANVLGNCLNRGLNMSNKYRNGAVPKAGELQDIDRTLLEKVAKLPGDLAAAYQKLELQHCALLPVDLARATNGYIDATAPFKLAKDASQSGRLDTVLNVATQAVYASIVGLLPILPEKAVAGLAQLGVDVSGGRTLSDLFATPLPEGHKVGQGSPLFPKIEPKT
ncbi:MAG TPA: class I tRNA ligase family protein, partial [Tepidisphaeraceae bacterium]